MFLIRTTDNLLLTYKGGVCMCFVAYFNSALGLLSIEYALVPSSHRFGVCASVPT